MNLDWNGIRYFATLVEKETLTAAAAALDVQHSTVSRQIAQLEQALGLRLFDHIGKRYLLTADGERLYRYACDLCKEMNVLERVHSLRSRTPKKAKITICRLVLNLRSQFFQSRLFFSNQEKLRSTTHRFGNTAKRCNSFRLAISTSAPINSCTDEANALPV